jgi:hypothetical protein
MTWAWAARPDAGCCQLKSHLNRQLVCRPIHVRALVKSDCPHCGKPIARRLVLSRPAPGERKILPMHAIQVCPLCQGGLATNTHPLEKRLAPLISVPLTIALALLVSYPGPLTGGLIVASVIICLVAVAYLDSKTKTWQRYKPYAREP